jgi:hypothetical protein
MHGLDRVNTQMLLQSAFVLPLDRALWTTLTCHRHDEGSLLESCMPGRQVIAKCNVYVQRCW